MTAKTRPLRKGNIQSLARWFMLGLQFVSATSFSYGQSPLPGSSTARNLVCRERKVPQLEDITATTGITFRHITDPEKKYIVESMSGGVLLIDFDRDGW